MRIKCPECQAALDIGTPKPGRYHPKCKHCGNAFRLKVTDDVPPKVGIARDPKPAPTTPAAAPKATSSSSPKQPAAPTVAKAPAASASKSKAPATVAGTSMDATMVSVAPVPATDATMDSVAPSVPAMDATMDSVAPSAPAIMTGSRSASVAPKPTKVSMSARDKTRADAVDETMAPVAGLQQTMDTAASAITKHSGKAKPAAARSDGEDSSMPARLGGYKLIRILGRGAMGAVYEAKQISLDRVVALKTIRDRLTGNPSALARFTREAYAAARLNHHNVVQIYDFGEDSGQHYFSMECVSGSSLSDVVRSRGPLEARVAATYVLQAARGLQYAHQSGMVHRDVKPANLMLSDEGVVKVADLGLVKVPDQMDIESDHESSSQNDMAERLSRTSGTQVTMMGTAIGTPAYMAPEQSVDATTVDHRADIYSLGCTLYYLLTGKPPYGASDITTLLSQHAREPIPQVRAAHPHVSEAIDKIIERSMAKAAGDRYPTLAGMISDLETFLGIQSGEKFSSSVAQADAWAANADQFRKAAPLASLRSMAMGGVVVFSVLLLLLTPWLGFSWILLGPICLIMSIVVSNYLESMQGESAVGGAARKWLGSLRLFDWIYAIGVSGLVLLVSVFAGCWLGLLVGALLGAALGAAYHYGLRVPIRTSRKSSLETAEQLVRQFRVSGADEEGLRTFVARYSGRTWGELFEALFGVDALIKMQDRCGQDPAIAKLSPSMRDRLVMNLAGRAQANHDARDQEKLSRVEQRALVSEGLSESEARDRAWQMASALMEATKFEPAAVASTDDQAAKAAEAKRQRTKAMMAEARSGKYAKKRDRLAPFKLIFGAQLRLAAGVALLALLAVWAHRTGVLSSDAIQSVASSLRQGDVNLADVGNSLRAGVNQAVETDAASATPKLLGSGLPSIAIAGLMLVASAFVSGWRMTPFAIVAAGIALWGSSFGIPEVGPVPAYALAAVAAFVVLVPGAMISERT